MNTTWDTDVLIAGGGPAGSATALALRKQFPNLRVTLVERGHYDQSRVGETLQPLVWQVLAHLGVWDGFREQGHVPAHGTRAVWGETLVYDNEFLFSGQGHGWHLDRARFDGFLAQSAQAAGVHLMRGFQLTTQVEGEPGAWLLKGRGPEGEMALRAAFLVDASGRSAVFATALGAEKQIHDRLLASYREYEAADEDGTTLVEAVEDGWWYSARLPNQRLMVAFMGDRKLALPSWTQKCGQTQHTQARIVGEPLTGLNVKPAYSQVLDRTCGDHWLAVGDAASSLDPLSSQGIFKALRTGIFAAYSIGDAQAGRLQGLARYQKMVQEEFASYLKVKQNYYNQEQRFKHHYFWKSRQQSFEPFADADTSTGGGRLG